MSNSQSNSGETESNACADKDDGEDVLFSQFLFHFDMLCDKRRNAAYDLHIERTIQRLRNVKAQSPNDPDIINVLDIGSGSGLLALLARKHSADNVTAIETMPLVAAVARANAKTQTLTLAHSELQNQPTFANATQGTATATLLTTPTITPSKSVDQHQNDETQSTTQATKQTAAQTKPNDLLVLEAHSTELNNASALKFPNDARAELIVAEILDSDLIGEGVIPTMRHAKEHLATHNFVALPATSTIWAALVFGPVVDKLSPPLRTGRDPAGWTPYCSFDATVGTCFGSGVPLDVHAAELFRTGQLCFASQVFKVFDFDWTQVPGRDGRFVERYVDAWAPGTGVLVWWNCEGEGGEMMSTRLGRTSPPDHWRQVLYRNPNPNSANSCGKNTTFHKSHSSGGSVDLPQSNNNMGTGFNSKAPDDKLPTSGNRGSCRVSVQCSHDDLEIWFGQRTPPACTCQVHRLIPDDYWWGVNNNARRSVLVAAVEELVNVVDAMENETKDGRAMQIISLGSSPITAMLLVQRLAGVGVCEDVGVGIDNTNVDGDTGDATNTDAEANNAGVSSNSCATGSIACRRVVAWCNDGLGRGRERLLNDMVNDYLTAKDLESSTQPHSYNSKTETPRDVFQVKLHEPASVLERACAVFYDPSRLDCGESQLEQAMWWKRQTDILRNVVGGSHLKMWPRSVRLVAQLVSCPELAAVHKPVGILRGIDMSGINALRTGVEAEAVSVRLWQYDHVIASDVTVINSQIIDQEQVLTFVTTCGPNTIVHGVSVRAEWDFGEKAGKLCPGSQDIGNGSINDENNADMGSCVDLSFFKNAQELSSGPAGRRVQVRLKLLSGSWGRKGPICTLLG